MTPEVVQLNRATSLVRIPPSDGVPLTPRVRRVLDSAPMRRLASISQLGMVSLVYPGATHSRLEHSLGVYLNALRLLARFGDDPRFQAIVDPPAADAFLLAALLHDVGHWPFCHPIEDLQLAGLRAHESRVSDWIAKSELAECIDRDWQCETKDVVELLEPSGTLSRLSSAGRDFLRSCLSGPVDIDKLDYLQRDSLHAGVPYGRNFDVARLIGSMCIHPSKPRLAIGEKGRTAAEMMVFSRYVMFSEVYWHHTVRSATAMLQRAVFSVQRSIPLESTFGLSDAEWIARLVQVTGSDACLATCGASDLLDGLFGRQRRLFKRVAEFNAIDRREVHQQIARRPYGTLVAASEKLAEQLTRLTGQLIRGWEVLIDAPPVKLEVDINVDVVARDQTAKKLADVSAVAKALADRQFDDQVKQVRIFVRPELRTKLFQTLSTADAWSSLLLDAISAVNDEIPL
ncbi:HD domain-containing protein [Novipirellula artificiosorum]|uniref:HD domain protein n=1 Tax=Novipirellula artificiosorum TaxID=2528016 RepID=A0A5C6DYG0_9BACT|nr:HD domain-containing protein [Novipirellula artificiosorum]TWU40441.1 HD domain protein [Novipirellula artificiosorum]